MDRIKKQVFLLLAVLWLPSILFSQKIVSGDYGSLKLAFDSHTRKLTGYFEEYTGWDERTKNPRFSCIFYIEGFVSDTKFSILTFYPEDKSEDRITGTLEIVNDKTVKIKLPEEHGGCWNVQHFVDKPVQFEIEQKAKWTQIRYVVADKTFFHSEKTDRSKQKAYIIKNDFVCINKIEHDWAYCTFFGENIKKGWIKIQDLNKN